MKRIFTILFNFVGGFLAYFNQLENAIKILKVVKDNQILRKSNYPFFLKILKNENDLLIAVDGGANGGFNIDKEFPKEFEKFFDKIFLIEPIKETINKYIDEKVTFINKGFWSSKMIKNLNVNVQGLGASSIYEINREGFFLYSGYEGYFQRYQKHKKIDIECDTIKNILLDKQTSSIDYLKLDIQGSEYEALKGMGDLRPLLISIEMRTFPLYKQEPNWGNILVLLDSMGYMLADWKESPNHITKNPIEINAVFVLKYFQKNEERIILKNRKKFIFLLGIFNQIVLLKRISHLLNFEENSEIQKLNSKINLLKNAKEKSIYFSASIIHNCFPSKFKKAILKNIIKSKNKKQSFYNKLFFKIYFDYWINEIYLNEKNPNKRYELQKSCLGGFDDGITYLNSEDGKLSFLEEKNKDMNKFMSMYNQIVEICHNKKNICVIQIGSCSGRKISYIAKKNPHINCIGIDIYESIISKSNQENTVKNLKYHLCPIQKISELLNKINCDELIIFSSGSIEYLQPEHLEDFLEEIKNYKNLHLLVTDSYYKTNISKKFQSNFSEFSYYNGALHYTHLYNEYAKKLGLENFKFKVNDMNNSCYFYVKI